MQNGLWWLVAVWSSFGVISVAHKIDTTVIQKTESIKSRRDLEESIPAELLKLKMKQQDIGQREVDTGTELL
jgi:hypothetical protein